MRITSDDPLILSMPSRYIQGAGSINRLGAELKRICRHPLLIIDEFVLSTYGESIKKSLLEANLTYGIQSFSGLCVQEKASEFSEICTAKNHDLVVGIGGGSAIDVAKGTAISNTKIDLKVASVPTVASNDAPTSRACVFYTNEGVLEKVQLLPSNPNLVLVDTAIIAKAPVRFLISGIGDALTTKFEAEQCMKSGHQSRVDGRQTLTGMAIGDLCYQTVKKYGEQAIKAVENKVVTEALEFVVEAAILQSGAGFENGGLSTAHALTRGLSKIPQLHGCLHGYEVAYGLMVQFVLEGRPDVFIEEMRAFYQKLSLPLSLADLGLKETDPGTVSLIVSATCENQESHVYKMTVPVNEQKLHAAISIVESMGQAK